MGDHVTWALGLGSVVCFWTRDKVDTHDDAEGRRGTPRDADAKDKELETTDTDDRMMVFRTFGFLYLFVNKALALPALLKVCSRCKRCKPY